MKKIRYFLEAAFLHTLFFISSVIPLDAASAFGGWIGRTVGPRLAASRKALNNLRRALPGKTEAEYRAIVRDMWDNLGRVMSEYPHLEQIGRERVEIINLPMLQKLTRDRQAAVLFTGHIANWEALVASALLQAGMAMDCIYRAPNNPWVNDLLNRVRSMGGRIKTIPKSRHGVRPMLETLKNGGYLGILVDQKYNEGLPISFFGRPAMTSPAYIQLAQKFNCPLIPGRIERLGGARFRITAYQPLQLFNADGTPRKVEDMLEESHRLLESWITERPEQWLWLHRRWGAEADQNSQS